jgi:membrane associated rhomboid family serine protease
MLIPMRPEELEAQGQPSATYAIIAIWFALHLACAVGLLELDGDRWGLVPGDLMLPAVGTHVFLHASWPHLIGASLLLLSIGPALEIRWGRLFYVSFLLLAAVLANGFYALLTPGLLRPLVGIGGGICALLGAGALLFRSSGLHYTTPFTPEGRSPVSLCAPVYVLAPVWLFCEIIMSLGDHPVGMTRGSAYWAQLAGLALGAGCAWGMRRWHVEARLPGASAGAITGSHPALAKAIEALKAGRHEEAFELLERGARERPDDANIITNLWETACACQKVQRAAPLVLLFVEQQITDGDAQLAASLWCELVGKAPKLQAHPRVLIELAVVLKRKDRKREAAWTLRCAAQQRRLLTGAALRIAELARGLHPSTGIAAARRALETHGLDQVKRARIEALIAELEREKQSEPEIDLDAKADRSIAIEFEDPLAPPPGVVHASAERDTNADSGFELSSDGCLVTGDTGVDLSGAAPETSPMSEAPPASIDDVALGTAASQPRFPEVKALEVRPLALGVARIELEQDGGRRGHVGFAQLQAIGVGAVQGLSAKPVILIDLIANWNDSGGGPLRVLRIRSDRFDVRRLVPEAGGPMDALRGLLDALFERSGAVALPDPDGARGRPVRVFADLATYQRQVLQAAS